MVNLTLWCLKFKRSEPRETRTPDLWVTDPTLLITFYQSRLCKSGIIVQKCPKMFWIWNIPLKSCQIKFWLSWYIDVEFDSTFISTGQVVKLVVNFRIKSSRVKTISFLRSITKSRELKFSLISDDVIRKFSQREFTQTSFMVNANLSFLLK